MDFEFTFILPCLNEEKALLFCLSEIQKYITQNALNAEILVADNNSTDNSREIAIMNGARVVVENKKGYGNTLINGCKHARGKYCIMGDTDGSYDFSHLDCFIKGIRNGYDLVVGNRFSGGIEHGAMSLSHKIGGQLLSSIGNFFFHTSIHDYHCGLRAYNREKILSLDLIESGMEYASEMIIKAKLNRLTLLEVPTILRKDLRNTRSHLRTVRDGFRHLHLIFQIALHKNKYIKEKQ